MDLELLLVRSRTPRPAFAVLANQLYDQHGIRIVPTVVLPADIAQPLRAKSKSINRDMRIRVHQLYEIGWLPDRIALQLKITVRQVRYAISHRLTPQHASKKGPSNIVNTPHRQQLKEWLLESPTRRNILWPEIPIILGWNYGERAIKSAMLALSYKRRVKRRRPFLTFTAQVKRLRYTTIHRPWRFHEWQSILFIDETWVRGRSHGQRFITIADGEELDYISTTEKKTSWMFWGSILGTRKGPCLVWEKSWGSITADSYQEHIVPLVHEFMILNPGCTFMQDNAPAHRARTTIADLTARGIRIMS
jgi:hypothetical protein